MTILAGVDLSYTSPAICIFNEDEDAKYENLKFYGMKEDKTRNSAKGTGVYGNIQIDLQRKWTCAEERYGLIRDWAGVILKLHRVERVQLEGYAMGIRAGLVFNIAENTSLLKQYMYLNGIEFDTPSPSHVKKNFGLKGNAKKPEMIARFHQLFPHVQLDKQLGIKAEAKPIDDIVDAFANLVTYPSIAERFLK